uniref:Trafficking protein particle complex II-specific subunit 65 IgD3 domain-containing protein n=1 Tax=Kwoniella pini CBS 10737 TaxID=1296096 RepID=A0A1B9HXC6_9TREE|nr:uncharacterized protein I206_05784 [Kwoniella pini CBS 10737]OCF47920.1 hypothetical protein I206_05784 [Kwoniella pini CBS 10737]
MPSPNLASSAQYEQLFQSSSLNLIIPEISSLPIESTDNSSESLTKWWDKVEESQTRNTAFFDEKLFYFLSMHLPDEALQSLPGTPILEINEPTSEMLRYLSRLQLTMIASFIPPLPPKQFTSASSMPTSSSSLTVPHTPVNQITSTVDGSNPPVTPNPFPTMHSGEEQYANVEGVIVWEGGVEEITGQWEEGKNKSSAGSGRKVIKAKDGWEIIWTGEVPIAYVRTQIQNPLLALTASITLRDQSHTKTHRRNAHSVDTSSIRSGTTTIRTDGTEYEAYEDGDDGNEYAELEEIDLLGGLAGGIDSMPSTRLAPSLREDLAVPLSSKTNSPLPISALTPATAPTIITPSTTSSGPSRERGIPLTSIQPIISTTLRKSYRRVLSLAPGLRVRMRTLFLPQLLTGDKAEEEGERCITLCVEIENSPELNLNDGFEVSEVKVDVGGKGGKASTELVKNQIQSIDFPLRLRSIEQYNLLYKVSIASSQIDQSNKEGIEEIVNKSLGRNDEIRPVSIIIIGKPFSKNKEEYKYQTKEFHSRWNCSLDLTSFYNSSNSSSSLNNIPSTITTTDKNRNLKNGSLQPTINAIAGDKRYSLAYLLSIEKENQNQNKRPLMPSQMIGQNRINSLNNNNNNHNYKSNLIKKEENGLMISIKLLPSSSFDYNSESEMKKLIKQYEIFSLEIFIYNKSNEIRRFKLIIPPPFKNSNSNSNLVQNKEKGKGNIKIESELKEILNKNKIKQEELKIGFIKEEEDLIIKQNLLNYLLTSTSILPLENDIRCGPLLPFTSLSTRIRFLALKKGIHKIESLRIRSNNDEFDFMIRLVTSAE